MTFSTTDYVVFLLYIASIIFMGLYVSRSKKGHKKDTSDYFLASKSLPWWAIGSSLIAANISAEQFIGMCGSGFALGLAIASYEWMAALTLIIVGKFFLPIFIKKEIYTMPQFLEKRFGLKVKYVMSVFWLVLYIVVNLTTIMWLGATAIHTLTGLSMMYGVVCLAAFAALYSLYGGLKAVAMADIIQVVLLVCGGILISCIALGKIGDNGSVISGFGTLLTEIPDKFDMVLSRDNPEYKNLPGIGVILGGMWIMNLSYWGFNQYIIQRALGAKNIREAQKGIIFAAFLKLLMPFIIVIPGIAAIMLAPEIGASATPAYDTAYPEMMKLAPVGIKGLIFAALVAAIVSSLGSMINSISTIFTLDLYRPLIDQNASETKLVNVGRTVSFLSLVFAIILAKPLLGNSPQVFQNIQNWTGFFTPGIVAIFFLGMFWKPTTELGGLVTVIGSVVLSLIWPAMFPEMPFMDRVGLVFLICLVMGIVVSFLKPESNLTKAINLNEVTFKTSNGFNLATVTIVVGLIFLYAVWW